jgi:hypothetical protein
LTGGPGAFTATITPTASGNVTISVAQGVAADAAGNTNTASNALVVVAGFDRPTVVLAGSPSSLSALDPFTITATFSEPVAGLDYSDVTVHGGAIISVSGANADYTISVVPDGTGNVTISIAGAVTKSVSFQIDNQPSNLLTIAFSIIDETRKNVSNFMVRRGDHLLNSQPGLIRLLAGARCRSFDANSTIDGSNVSGCFEQEGVLASLSASMAENDNYALLALGVHRRFSSNFLLGMMMEGDFYQQENASGRGWLVGPYWVIKHAQQPAYFEGRVLVGRTRNSIAPFSTYSDVFKTERLLIQGRLTGEISLDRIIWQPFFDLSWLRDAQRGYVDSFEATIGETIVDVKRVIFGVDFKAPLEITNARLDLDGGASLAYSETKSNVIQAGTLSSYTFSGGLRAGVTYRKEDFELDVKGSLLGLGTPRITHNLALLAKWRF